MPLYEYECGACGKRFEVIRKFSDPPLDVCTECGKGPLQRLISSPAFQFKGSGWYVTDYAKKGEGGKGDSGKADKTATEKTQDAKSDAAAAGKGSDKGSDNASDTGSDKGSQSEGKSEPAAKADSPAKPAVPSTTKD